MHRNQKISFFLCMLFLPRLHIKPRSSKTPICARARGSLAWLHVAKELRGIFLCTSLPTDGGGDVLWVPICVFQWFKMLGSKTGWKWRGCTASDVIYLSPKEHRGVCSCVELLSVPLKLLPGEMIMIKPPFIWTAWASVQCGDLPVLAEFYCKNGGCLQHGVFDCFVYFTLKM